MKKLLLLLALFGVMGANSLDEILASKTLRVGILNDQPPFSNRGSDGKYKGFDVSIGEEIAQQLIGDGAKVEFIGIDNLADRVNFLNENKIDIAIASLSMTPEREKIIDYCNPYFTVGLALLAKQGGKIFEHANDMQGARIVVQEGSRGDEFLQSLGGVDIVRVHKSTDGYKMVRKGEADGYLNDTFTIMAYPIVDDSVYIPEHMGNLGTMGYMAPAVQKGNTALRDKVNEAMVQLNKQKHFRAIYEDTFGVFYRHKADPDKFLLEDLYQMYE